MNIKIPLLSPIRFYNPNLAFDNDTTFQNPDNRVSTGYNWEGVKEIQYALPIPKQWPDYQPGIDFLVNVESGTFYAQLFDFDDVLVKDLYVNSWEPVGSDIQYRVWLDGVSGSGITDGYYTIKLFDVSDDSLLFESEALSIADWFEDVIPFEYWNFENDFGLVYDNGDTMFTGRLMVPIRLYDPVPTFEKEMYKNDPGVLTTLRTIPQRVFNFDSLLIPVHLAELIQLAFSNSELYLDRIKINSEEAPEAELIEGSNLKQITGKATFVNFNDEYMHENVETSLTDENIDWDSDNYATSTITGNSIEVNVASTAGFSYAFTESFSNGFNWNDGDIILIKLDLTDDGSSDLPLYRFSTDANWIRFKEWGTHWISLHVGGNLADSFLLGHLTGEAAIYTAVFTLYSIN